MAVNRPYAQVYEGVIKGEDDGLHKTKKSDHMHHMVYSLTCSRSKKLNVLGHDLTLYMVR